MALTINQLTLAPATPDTPETDEHVFVSTIKTYLFSVNNNVNTLTIPTAFSEAF